LGKQREGKNTQKEEDKKGQKTIRSPQNSHPNTTQDTLFLKARNLRVQLFFSFFSSHYIIRLLLLCQREKGIPRKIVTPPPET